MIEAIVGALLRSVLVSLLAGLAFTGLVAVMVRVIPLRAATRHALWSIALFATAAVPLASFAGSFLHRSVVPVPGSAGVPVRNTAVAENRTLPRDAHVAKSEHAREAARPASLAYPQPPASSTQLPPPGPQSSRFAVAMLRLPSLPVLSRSGALAIVLMWAAGALVGFVALAGSLIRVRSLKARSSPLEAELCDELPWLVALDETRETYLRLSYEIETPIAIGFTRPVILIPTELASAEGLGAIEPLVVHEHAHLQRYDDWTNMLGRVVERLFWFHPIVWYIGRQIALEREIAADDVVVERTGEAKAYATSLWQLAREMRMPAHAAVAPGALFTRKQIAVRIEQLVDENRARLRRSPALAGFAAVAVALVIVALGVSAPAIELPAASTPLSAPAPAAAPQRVVKVLYREAQAAKSTASKAPARTSPTWSTASRPVTSALHRSDSRPSKATRTVTHVETNTSTNAVAYADGATKTHAKSVAMAEPPSARGASDAATVPAAPTAPAAPAAPAIPTTPAAPAAPPALAPHRKIAQADDRVGEDLANRIKASVSSAVGAQIGADVAARVQRQLQNSERVGLRHHALDENAPVTRESVADCMRCDFSRRDLHGLDLHGLNLTGMDFTRADLHGANLSGATIAGSDFTRANLEGADLRNATLRGVDLERASIDGAKLDGMTAVGLNLSELQFGSTPIRALLQNCIGCDLSGFDLSGQDLHGIKLRGSNLSHANLQNANLTGAELTGVNFAHANLADADLRDAKLTGCNFSRANLTGVKLS